MNLVSFSCGSEGNQDEQEVPEHPNNDDHDREENKESLCRANKQKEEDEDNTALPMSCAPAAESPPPTIVNEMEEIFLRLGFSQAVVMKLVDDQGIGSPRMLAYLMRTLLLFAM